MFTGKIVYAKDNRENINASQRKRGYYFLKDVKSVIEEIQWVDDRVFHVGDTTITYSPPLPHGSINSPLGFVLATTIEYSGKRFFFAPDVQGPTTNETLAYILSIEPDIAIIGGPPLYLHQFSTEEAHSAFYSLSLLTRVIRTLVVDHHNMRGGDWEIWSNPLRRICDESGNKLLSMAELAGMEEKCFESRRKQLYIEHPPSEEFLNWTHASEEYKLRNMPPI
jgi:hypothetical protein